VHSHCRFPFLALGLALLLPIYSGAQQRVSTSDAVIEDFSNRMTATDTGFNDFSGNMGAING
jgi:hypothetical protein